MMGIKLKVYEFEHLSSILCISFKASGNWKKI